MKRVVLDIEASNLIQNGLDYTKLPYRLKDDFNVWCVVCRDIDSGEVASFVGESQIKKDLKNYLLTVDEIVGHNLISYDLPVLKLWAGIDYRVGYLDEEDTLLGKPIKIWDTLVLSYLLYSDTVQGHSLEAWGLRFGNPKIDFHDFSKYSEEMRIYCEQDTAVNAQLFLKQMEEYGSYTWSTAYKMEAKLADITLSQELYGFKFNKELAEKAVLDLTEKMQSIEGRVNPTLPPKPLNKGEAKEYIPPKIQFKRDGSLSAVMLKWIEKHNGKLEGLSVELYGKTYELPIPQEPIVTTGVATVDDGEHVKWYLLSLNWNPTQYKERDLTIDQKKKKRTKEKFLETVDRYVEQTLNGPFREWRLATLEVKAEELRSWILSKDFKKPIRVPTAPTLTVGVEKEICPNLLAMADKFPFAKDVVEYYTYKHRKNSIAGGIDEDGEPTSGFMVQMREEDGRIPTPANTNGTNTGRYTHRGVCNIARVTSLYGYEMRSLFGVDRSKDQVQLGFDFSSLEALCQAHFCLPYTGGQELAKTLMAEKPNDIHSVNGRKMGVDRATAKTLGYSLMYGAQPAKIAKSMGITLPRAKKLYEDYWKAVPALKELKDKLIAHWESNDKKYVKGIDGRKVYTRSAHSLINAIFQNCGALAAKYTDVLIHQKLEACGLWGNLFERDIHTTPSVQQMIVYHDEDQFSLHKSLVSFKIFNTEEEAKNHVTKDSSAVCHVNDKYFLAYSPMSGIISEAIEETEKLLKLRVKLGFEWQVGDSWASCH